MAIEVDIIILSHAAGGRLADVTNACISSLLVSENPRHISFSVLVIESDRNQPPYPGSCVSTLYPDTPFGYNRYMNLGIRKTYRPYVCLCNNDLFFHPGWASAILEVFAGNPEIWSANPLSPDFPYDPVIANGPQIIPQSLDYSLSGVLTGWCIFTRRNLFEQIGLLDERFEFWFADRDYALTLEKYGIEHVLIRNSLVTHLGEASHSLLGDRRHELTEGQRAAFEEKWHTPGWITAMNRLKRKIRGIRTRLRPYKI